MKIGYIYDFLGATIRIMMLDDTEVFYELVYKDDTRNSTAAQRIPTTALLFKKYKTLIYSKIPLDFLLKNGIFIKKKEFDENQPGIYRPDLPLRLYRFHLLLV